MEAEVAAAGLTIFWSTFIGPVVDPTVNTLIQRAKDFFGRRNDQARWEAAAEAYRQHILKHYNQLTILGKSERVALSNVFTDVNIFEGTLARIPYEYEELQKQAVDRVAFQHQESQRTNGMALVKQGENLFIVGKPGAGKTTFLRHLAVQAATTGDLNRVPIFISLNAWANSPYGEGDHPQLLPFLVHEFTTCHFDDPAAFIEQLLTSGKALVLFDGLDEVKQEHDQRRKLRQLIEDFARHYDQSQHLLTCRIAASDYLFKGFRDVEMADFTAEQVQRYATLWFAGADKKRKDFLEQLGKPENAGVRELCTIPLLLSMVCLYFDYRQDFPPNRAELYERALNYLLDEWDASRDIRRDEIARGETIYRELSPERKKRLFARIAAQTFEQGIYFFRQRDLEKWISDYLAALPNVKPADAINAKAVLKAIEAEHSIFVERAQGIYAFSHLSFQEFFTARYIVDNQARGALTRLIDQHLIDNRWREVVLLVAGLLDPESASEFCAQLRLAADQRLVADPHLLTMLRWAAAKAEIAQVPDERRSAVRLAYISLDLALDLALARALALALDLALALARALALDLALARARDLALALARARESINALAQALSPAVALDYALYYSWGYAALFAAKDLPRDDKGVKAALAAYPQLLAQTGQVAAGANAPALAGTLAKLRVPGSTARVSTWQKFADQLWALLQQRDLVHEWQFGEEQMKRLDDYFAANRLLVDCLKVAVVAERQAILHSLLLPPAG